MKMDFWALMYMVAKSIYEAKDGTIWIGAKVFAKGKRKILGSTYQKQTEIIPAAINSHKEHPDLVSAWTTMQYSI